FLLCEGWWMSINAHLRCDSHYIFHPVDSLWKFAPGSVDRTASMSLMLRITGLLGVVCFVSDLAQRSLWLKRLWYTIGFTGAALILFGLEQKATGWPLTFTLRGPAANRLFATYYYHGNAGA